MLSSVPYGIKSFLIRALVIFSIWSLLYHLVLLPARIPDRQLTYLTAQQTKFLLSFIYNADSLQIMENQILMVPKNIILYNNKRIIGIADGCNGLELYVLYLSFLLCFPTTLKKFMFFSIIGLTIIFIANNFRCATIAMLNFNSSSLSEVAHHYVFKLLIYAIMFLLWMKYTKNRAIEA